MIAAREMMSIPVTTTATRTMMTMSNSRSGSAKTEKRGGRILRASRSILPIFLVYLLQCAAVPCLASTAPHVAAATPTLQQQHLRRQQQRQQKYPHEKAEARSRRNVASHDSFHRVMAETKAASDSSSSVTCKPADVCVMCTGSDKEKWSACARTGRMQRFECFSNANDDADNEKSHERAEIRSCERTQADEHFLMMQFMISCLVIGGVAVLSVRKQKRVSASLFDQRKFGAQQKPKRNTMVTAVSSVADEGEIEFSTMSSTNSTMEEIAPLVTSSSGGSNGSQQLTVV